MEFCSECDNYMILKVEEVESNKKKNKMLRYECNNCGHHKYTNLDKENSCVYSNNYENNKFKLDNIDINYIAQDPTLPRVNNLQCLYKDCPSNNDKAKADILYVNIDENTATYLYKCNNCNKTWTNK
jgi:DNA-directed RNA polymerase subunit M/transcription elongation factor TFIIS